MKHKTTHTTQNPCPTCGKPIDAATPAMQADARLAPSPGDIGICFDCGAAHIFADDLTLRAPTSGEAAEIASELDVIKAQKALAAVKKRSPQ